MKKISTLEKLRIIQPFIEHEVKATLIAKGLNFSVKTLCSWIKSSGKEWVCLVHQTKGWRENQSRLRTFIHGKALPYKSHLDHQGNLPEASSDS